MAVEADLRPQPVDDAEKSAGRAPAVQAPDASRWQWEHRAAPEALSVVSEPCKPAAVRFGERSCAAPEAAEQQDAAQSEPPVRRLPKLPGARRSRW